MSTTKRVGASGKGDTFLSHHCQASERAGRSVFAPPRPVARTNAGKAVGVEHVHELSSAELCAAQHREMHASQDAHVRVRAFLGLLRAPSLRWLTRYVHKRVFHWTHCSRASDMNGRALAR